MTPPDSSAPPPRRRRVSRARQIIAGVVCLAAFWVYYLFGTGRIMTYEIDGNSMAPTLLPGDRLFVSRSLDPPIARGDIVIFPDPRPALHDDMLIKRVVALPGDEIEVRGHRLYVNGMSEFILGLEDPAVPDMPDQRFTLGEGEIYVLGDNRANSFDSTEFEHPLPASEVIGRPSICYWPLRRSGRVD
jgi:signal peptidase I